MSDSGTISQAFLNRPDPESKSVKHTINLDWFQAMIIGDLISPDDHDSPPLELSFLDGFIRFRLNMKGDQPAGNKHFKYIYRIYYRDNRKFGECLVIPRNNVIMKDSRAIMFKAENFRLYEGGFCFNFNLFLESMKWKFDHFTRLDIAVDGGSHFTNILKMAKGKIFKLGRAEFKPIYEGNMKLKAFYVGNSQSQKSLRAYDKRRHIKQFEHKQYIEEFWTKNRLHDAIRSDKSRVERLELQLRSDAIKAIPQADVEKMDQMEHLAGMMKIHFKNWFEFVESKAKTGIKTPSHRPRLESVDWDSLRSDHFDKINTKGFNMVKRIRQAIKTNWMMFYFTKLDEFRITAFHMADEFNCYQWFMTAKPYWRKEFDLMADDVHLAVVPDDLAVQIRKVS